MIVSSILNSLKIPLEGVYSSSMPSTFQKINSAQAETSVNSSDSVSISESASLLNTISNINAKLDSYEKSITAGDVESIAKNVVALKLELVAFKEKIKSMQLQFQVLDTIMDMINDAQNKLNRLGDKI